MVQIIKRNPSFSEELAKSLGGGISKGIGEELQFGRQKELQGLKSKKETKDLQGTYTSILDQMKGLKDYVGPKYSKISALNPFGETAGKRSQIDTARLSLEGLFRDLTLKGQFPKAIYERILQHLPNSEDTESQFLNKIEAIENILGAHYGSEKEPSSSSSSKKEVSESKAKKPIFNPQNPEHKAKAKQLHKTYGDTEKVREILRREYEGV